MNIGNRAHEELVEALEIEAEYLEENHSDAAPWMNALVELIREDEEMIDLIAQHLEDKATSAMLDLAGIND